MNGCRPGRPGDLAQVRRIQLRTLPEPCPELLACALAGHPTVLVREIESTILGYVLAVANSDRRVCYVAELAVSPDHQGEGHGSTLLETMMQEFEDFRAITVTVEADTDRTRQFYARHGFEQRRRLPGYFEDGDGLLLVCSLEDGDGLLLVCSLEDV